METTMRLLMLCLVTATALAFPLSEMDTSVDDMYYGCSEAVAEMVKNEYFPREMKSNAIFKNDWKAAKFCANKKYITRVNKGLTKDQLRALCIYTADSYSFNKAVREGAASYTTNTFKYHAFHYWLTKAVQTIKKDKTCSITYRRSDDEFTGELNQVIRFGSFASTSTSPDLLQFGSKTCFHIETCFGAPIRDYSLFPEEDEVLIPPYEMFKIVEITYGSYEYLHQCDKIFVLKNAGRKSSLNCTRFAQRHKK